MSLTSLELTIDQSRPGWLDRAGREAAELLGAHGRPQMATALATALSARPELAALQRFLRLRLLPGSAPSRDALSPVDRNGALDGRRASPGHVPRRPELSLLFDRQPIGPYWNIGAGEMILDFKGLSGPVPYALRHTRLHADGRQELLAEQSHAHPFTHACCDGQAVALLQPVWGNEYTCLLVELESGKVLWTETGLWPSKAHSGSLSLALTEQAAVLFNGASGQVRALRRADGEALWEHRLPIDTTFPAAHVVDGLFCVVGGKDIHAIDPSSGAISRLGNRSWGRPSRCWGAHGHLYLTHREQLTTRYNLLDGSEQDLPYPLSRPEGDGRAMQALAAGEDTLVLATAGTLIGVGLAPDWPVLWTKAVGRLSGNFNELTVVGDAVIMERGGGLSAFNLRTGEALWEDFELPFTGVELRGHPGGILASGGSGELLFIHEAA